MIGQMAIAIALPRFNDLGFSVTPFSFWWARVRCKTNNNILLFSPLVQDANDSIVPRFDFVLCIMTSTVPFYMDHKPFGESFSLLSL